MFVITVSNYKPFNIYNKVANTRVLCYSVFTETNNVGLSGVL